jgi:hypothetical protein
VTACDDGLVLGGYFLGRVIALSWISTQQN